MSNTRIGVLGGTFDPIHCGHLRLALEVKERLSLDEVRLMPAPAPRLREPPFLGPRQRLHLVELAVQDCHGLVADSRELRQEGETLTVRTLEEMRSELSGAQLILILGADAFNRFDKWVRHERILALAGIAVARRPGAKVVPPANLAARIHEGSEIADGDIVVCDIPALDISATAIRALRAAGRSVRYLVPDRVCDHLEQEGLYLYAK